jgi:pseudouridine-5'-monophosphatase
MRLRETPAALIYDLDGVLLDTEPFYTLVTQEIVGEFGKTFDWSVKSNMIGRPSLESARYLVEALDLPIAPEAYLARRARRLEELFLDSPPRDGAERFTREMARRGVPQAIATSSERRLFEIKASRHREWFGLFRTVVTGDDPRVRHGKPAPDIFLCAADDLGVRAERCAVFEDAPSGVAAARAAGMSVIALPDPAMDRSRYEGAAWIVDSFEDITVRDLGFD